MKTFCHVLVAEWSPSKTKQMNEVPDLIFPFLPYWFSVWWPIYSKCLSVSDSLLFITLIPYFSCHCVAYSASSMMRNKRHHPPLNLPPVITCETFLPKMEIRVKYKARAQTSQSCVGLGVGEEVRMRHGRVLHLSSVVSCMWQKRLGWLPSSTLTLITVNASPSQVAQLTRSGYWRPSITLQITLHHITWCSGNVGISVLTHMRLLALSMGIQF